MKKLFMIAMFVLSLSLVTGSLAADVVVTVTVPDAYVARLTAMVEAKCMHPGNFSCTDLTVKQCFTKMMIVEQIKKLLFQWERAEARKAATISADASVTEIEVNSE
ncbi:hypothetical protein LCGC14_2073530 [marine sediment metagenome]|uniref:Uncharacterized protein n=1 Tax=marine sediment metagenome TaxID=412755 RepID=A0A0F9GW04_9ZZZZ